VIAAIAIAILVSLAVAYVLAPLRRGAVNDAGADEFAEEALARKKSALDALIEIDEERAVGKLSASDHDALRSEYELEAVRALNDLDALAVSDDDLESEIAAMRDRLACRKCGALRTPGERCPRCGS
jgi:hypothetical protein